jgi:hypothetical protein
MKYLLYNLDNESLVVESVDSTYNPSYILDERQAMQFGIQQQQQNCNELQAKIDFIKSLQN